VILWNTQRTPWRQELSLQCSTRVKSERSPGARSVHEGGKEFIREHEGSVISATKETLLKSYKRSVK
jgi:hypothetical protein